MAGETNATGTNMQTRRIWATFFIAAVCGVGASVCQLLCPYIGLFSLFPLVLTFVATCYVINIEARMKLFTDEKHRQRFLGKWRRISERGGMPFDARKLLGTSMRALRSCSYVLSVIAVIAVPITIGVGACVYWLAAWEQTFTTPFVFDWCIAASPMLYAASCLLIVGFGVLAWITAGRYRKAARSDVVQRVLLAENEIG